MEYTEEFDILGEASGNATGLSAGLGNGSDPGADYGGPGAGGRWYFDGPYYDLTQLAPVYGLLTLLGAAVMLVGLTGNAMVIAVVCRHRAMRTPTNFYIISLALSDFAVTSFVMPLKLLELSADADLAFLSAPMCSVLGFIQPYFVFNSIWTLVAISIDRYLVIIHPLKSRSFNTRGRASRNVAAIWLLPFLVLAGYFYPHATMNYRMASSLGVIRRTTCASKLSHTFLQWYSLLQFAVLLLVPVALLCFTCFSIARRLFRLTEDEKMLKTSLRKEEASRRKVAKMVLVVVFAFVICWAPFFVVTLCNHFLRFLLHRNFFFWQSVLFLMGFSNSCMNPIIYAFMSRAFRRGFRGIIACVCPCVRPCLRGHGAKYAGRNPRRSVTIISSEPATETCRVTAGGTAGGGRRRGAGGRWNNTQYSAISETDNIEMAKVEADAAAAAANGGPNASPGPADRNGVGKAAAGNNPPPRCADIHEEEDGQQEAESPFVEVCLDGPPRPPPSAGTPAVDLNRNRVASPAKGDLLHDDAEEPECTAPLLKPETEGGTADQTAD